MTSKQLRRHQGPLRLGRDDHATPILHVDMDAFYASVSLLDRPDLIGQPVVVGASGSRGVVLSATYEARALGIHSAMPIARARRLAPNAVYLDPDYEHYSAVSAGVMEIFGSITPDVEPLSLDEAFLDVSGARRRLGSPAEIGELIRAQVADEQGITCSVGVGSNKFIAKMASSQCKPDGLLVVPADEVIAFLHPQPVSALWGVGDKTEERLHRLGLRTIGDIAATPEQTLCRVLGEASGKHLAALAWGRDERAVSPGEPRRSIGADQTFAKDLDDPEQIRAALLGLSQRVAVRLRRAGYRGSALTLRVRFADFTTISRTKSIAEPTDVARAIYSVTTQLYDRLGLQRARLRLVGIRVEHLVDADNVPVQLTLDGAEENWRNVEVAADSLIERFGSAAVRPARLIHNKQPDSPDVADKSTGR